MAVTVSVAELLTELDRAKVKRAEQRRLAPHPISRPRMAVWQQTPIERRRYLRGRCGRSTSRLA